MEKFLFIFLDKESRKLGPCSEFDCVFLKINSSQVKKKVLTFSKYINTFKHFLLFDNDKSIKSSGNKYLM